MRQFFKQKAIPENSVEAVKYFQQQTEKYWMDVNLQQKALIALQLFRNNRKDKARIIVKSLKETSILSEEKGMYWKANKAGWLWSEAPTETQALLIETFSEIEPTPKIIEKLKLWLLKNKQVNRWNTTKATAAAIHALVHYGIDLHDITNTPTVSVGTQKIIPEKSEDTKIMAGTGYFKTSWTANEISNDMSTVEIKPTSKTALWGGLYWQYFENLNAVSATESSLKIEKKLFKKVTTENGLKLVPISEAGAVKIGDIVTTKIVLYSDRDMQYLHIKDNRASGLEPLDNISKYKWQDGISFYQSIRDTATNFFFDYLPKGIYVFEYDTRASHTGIFSTGIAMIENFYAPELRSNSKGSTITIKN
ncbi:hypothetical protein [Tenacibaculum sp. SG-28]|uniref:alpha-2-macroglobulin family protein n=1 Tax=Tenacibaculum sp. SG-28 TaxID=754426 RepID=UPI000CF3B237|nr:hypothetical protein [Tenacibaculum sp. SG-28]PQJ20631.1 hypothetical protein BSU00_10005 [Tenacibaculum sp. SG-28]